MASRPPTGTESRQGHPSHAKAALPEEGNSLLEMTFGTAFLLLVVVVLFESTMIFRAYIGVLNSAREGAFYAAHHPGMVSGGQITCEDASPDGDDPVVFMWHICQEAIAAGLDPEYLQVLPPETPEGIEPQDPLIVTVEYDVLNPTHSIVLPWLGRMGLLDSFPVSASSEVPIRFGLE